MSAATTSSRTDNRIGYDAELGAMLDGLQDLNMSDDIYEEAPFISAHGGQCDIFKAKSRKHRDIAVAVKRLRLHALDNKNASKVCVSP